MRTLVLSLALAVGCTSSAAPDPGHDASDLDESADEESTDPDSDDDGDDDDHDDDDHHDGDGGSLLDASAPLDADVTPPFTGDAASATEDAGDVETPPSDAGTKRVQVTAYTSDGARQGVNAHNGVRNTGRQFEVTREGLEVTALGAWDEGANGLTNPHTVALFRLDRAGQGASAMPVVGGQVLVPAGQAATLDNGYRFSSLATPVTLERGYYAVVVYGLDAADPYGDGGNIPASSTGIRDANFDVFEHTEAAFPAYPQGGDSNAHASASFRYTGDELSLLRIMPLGASITEGAQSSGGGYRARLAELLDEQGLRYQFVGSLSNNTAPALGREQIHHEGHSGYVIEAGSSGRAGVLDSITQWAGPTGAAPDVFLLLLGTNDVDLDYKLNEAGARMDALLTRILDADVGLRPGAQLIMARLPPIADPVKDARMRTYNDAIAATAEQHRLRGERVSVVDVHSAITRDDLADNLHPNDAGYRKIAQIWFEELQRTGAFSRQ